MESQEKNGTGSRRHRIFRPHWLIYVILISISWVQAELPEGFVYADEYISGIQTDARYFGAENFLGRPVKGYQANRVVLSREAADALALVQKDLEAFGLGLLIFDAYRPTMAVEHFVEWARDLADTLRKADYYPEIAKKDLFKRGYIASKSGHSRGSTVDLTLRELRTGQVLDMGGSFDLFSPISHIDNTDLPAQALANRALLHYLMKKHGFRSLAEEWWHFTLNREPYPETYFSFPVE